MLKISEFSKQSNFSIRMLRYLEEQGLLVAIRKDNNYRFYNKSQLEEAREIKSSTIPKQKNLIANLELDNNQKNLFTVLQDKIVKLTEVPIRSEKSDLQRVAYSIPYTPIYTISKFGFIN